MSKIYSQSVAGRYREIKNYSGFLLLLLYFGASWIRWSREGIGANQAILIDLASRRGYFFGIEIGPEEVYYITAILLIAAFGLFLVTSIFGRIWCGYTCPHTVLVDLFIKVESFFQGDRNARIRLDCEPFSSYKFIRKAATHCSWIILSWFFAFGWVCYFYESHHLVKDMINQRVSTNGLLWMFGLTLSTYIFAGFMREKMCAYICPYGRFQSAMLDKDSLLVTYHDWRGEPRAQDGDCIDCNRCVAVCPMGIDIRDGLQMQCISCGLCIDACDEVMEKIGKPIGLISYDSVHTTESKRNGEPKAMKFLRPKTLFYGISLVSVLCLLFSSLSHKLNFIAIVERERDSLFTITPDGMIRNTYDFSISNRHLKECEFCISMIGSKNYRLKIQKYGNKEYVSQDCIDIQQNTEETYKVFVKDYDGANTNKYNDKIVFSICDSLDRKCMEIPSLFIYNQEKL